MSDNVNRDLLQCGARQSEVDSRDCCQGLGREGRSGGKSWHSILDNCHPAILFWNTQMSENLSQEIGVPSASFRLQ